MRRARVAVLRLSSAVGMAVACRGEGPGVSRVTVTWRPAAARRAGPTRLSCAHRARQNASCSVSQAKRFFWRHDRNALASAVATLLFIGVETRVLLSIHTHTRHRTLRETCLTSTIPVDPYTARGHGYSDFSGLSSLMEDSPLGSRHRSLCAVVQAYPQLSALHLPASAA